MQTLNLYLPEFKPDRSPLRLSQMGLVALIVVLLLLMFSVFYARSNNQLAVEQAMVDQQLNSLKAQRDSLQKASAATDSSQLDAQIVNAEIAISTRRSLRNQMALQSGDDAPALSQQMRALALSSSSDFSLDAFALLHAGNYVELAGKSRTRSALPVYLQKLKLDSAFADTRFGTVLLDEAEDSGLYYFRLGTLAGGEHEAR
ncbi:MAG TPA: hypothetical protein VIC08_09340 [Cellvibrionaceae bacterium]